MRVAIALLAACGAGTTAERAGELGLNDVSILIPPSASFLTMSDGDGLVPHAVFDRVVRAPGDVSDTYADFHLVAVRFDLCDRVAAGPCPAGDGRLRIVLQPLRGEPPEANDVALHAAYPVPEAELGAVVDELRALAAIANTPPTSPLGVSPPLVARDAEYARGVRALVTRYATSERLARLTLFAQDAKTSALVWAFRGEELRDGRLERIAIPDVDVVQQRAILTSGDTTYNTSPVADAPAGFMLALAGERFAAAAPAERMTALESLAAVQNPARHGSDSVQCVACHVSTFLTARRARVAGIDPRSIAGTFAAPFDLGTSAGVSTTNDRALRAFGWVGREPAISQRVVNESAQVLLEIASRFP